LIFGVGFLRVEQILGIKYVIAGEGQNHLHPSNQQMAHLPAIVSLRLQAEASSIDYFGVKILALS
jgi:hypothetical protein